ncbi:translation initiation factor IF-3 [bacterium]|nr:translation initiation factor IF-3 [bacterium]
MRPFNPRFRPESRPQDGLRINHRIRAREVRVIGADGAQLGVMETRKAIELAMAAGLDLAEVSPNSVPPVCKILDYGKFKYQAKKKAKTAKKNQAVTTLKEVQFRPQTDTHDIDFKVKHILRFLEEGNKVKVSCRFRGREAAHADLGYALIKQIIDMVGPSGIVEANPKMEGKILSMTFGPGAKTAKKPEPKASPDKSGDETPTKSQEVEEA